MMGRAVPSSDSLRPGNPFASRCIRPDQVDFIFEPAHSFDRLLAALQRYQWRGQVIGPHGNGKTTLLWKLARHCRQTFDALSFVQLQHGQRYLRQAKRLLESSERDAADSVNDHRGVRSILIIDGFEQLNFLSRTWLKTWARVRRTGLVVSGHSDLGLSTVYHAQTTPEQLTTLFKQLYPGQTWSDSQSESLLSEFGNNAREVLFQLYDQFELDGYCAAGSNGSVQPSD